MFYSFLMFNMRTLSERFCHSFLRCFSAGGGGPGDLSRTQRSKGVSALDRSKLRVPGCRRPDDRPLDQDPVQGGYPWTGHTSRRSGLPPDCDASSCAGPYLAASGNLRRLAFIGRQSGPFGRRRPGTSNINYILI